MRWIGWERVNAGNPFGDGTIDNQLAAGGIVHLTEDDVGGYSDDGQGETGRAACGVTVPADDPDVIARWRFNGRQCKRCVRSATACSLQRDGFLPD